MLAMLVLLIVVFGSVLLWSLVQHRRTARSLELLHAGYLPLALRVGEAKATQTLFATVVDRVLREPDPTASREWLEVAGRVRPSTLEAAFQEIDEIEALKPEARDQEVVRRSDARLRAVQQRYEGSQGRYAAFFSKLAEGDQRGAENVLSELRSEERKLERELRSIRHMLQSRIAELSAAVAQQERNAAVLLLALVIVALLAGSLLVWLTYRMLAPLPRLQRRVSAVAEGDLSPVALPKSDNELGQLTDAFEDMVKALRDRDRLLIRTERLAAVGKMAAHVSHEVRNPLSSIGLNVDLLRDEVGATDEAKALLDSIQKELDRLTKVTEEYLRVARLPHPQREVGDVAAVVHSLVEFLQQEMRQDGVSLVVEVEEGLPAVRFDEGQLRQALLNLLRNAREAMAQGGEVQLTLQKEDAGVRFVVADQGPGIDAETRENIFDLFFTTKKQGSGLGLSLTQQIVVAHGGVISCQPNEPKGTRFAFWLPGDQEANPTQGAHPAGH